VGVFAGKFQIGSDLNALSFRLYTDSSKALWVAYTVVLGKDTLKDTLKTAFNDMAGEVYVPVILKSGPDAGKCLLMRGHYDPNLVLLMGPIDMIAAPAKGSLNFGSGPYMGQFAASGRGEDVSRYLPNNGGNTTGPITNPVNNPPTTPTGYRLPPQGTDSGAVIAFNGSTVIYIDAFGDTLATMPGANFRGQPDGSFDYDQDWSYRTPDGKVYHHIQAGGHVFLDNQGNWVVDGHFFQESDSNGIHKSIPGQMCARVAKASFTIGLDGAKGNMKGWIFQDANGGGFTVQPLPICPTATATNCQMPPANTCDPTKGTCTTDPNQCPAGQVCGPVNPPPTSYSRPFMSGAANYRMFVSNKIGAKDGDYFYVQMGGRVYRVKNDTVGVSAALAPMCGQVVLKLELLPMKDGTDLSKQAHNADSMSFQMGQSVVLAMEDQNIGGQPAFMDKARDSYGDVHNIVPLVEMRPLGSDYGKAGTQCPATTGPIVQNPPCDPTKGTCNQPCDPTKGACTPPCDPATTANCNQPPVGGPQAYVGSLDAVKAALVQSNNLIGVVQDSTGAYIRIEMNPLTLFKDPGSQYVFIADKLGTNKYVFFADPSDKSKLAVRDNYPMAAMAPNQGPVNNPPADTTKVVNNPPPGDTIPPPLYKGTQDNLALVMNQMSWKANMRTPQGPVAVRMDNTTLHLEGNVWVAGEAGNVAHLFIFLGDKIDPTKLAMDAAGMVVVMEKVLTAGP